MSKDAEMDSAAMTAATVVEGAEPGMIERVARVLASHFTFGWELLPKDSVERRSLGHPNLPTQDQCLDAARDVLAAMQEPTSEMWDCAETASILSAGWIDPPPPMSKKKARARKRPEYLALAAKVHQDAHSFPTYRIWQGVVMYRAMIRAALGLPDASNFVAAMPDRPPDPPNREPAF